MKNAFANRDWSPAPNLITASARVVAESTPLVSWIIRGLAKRTAIPKPAPATPFKTSTNAAHTMLIILTNAFAAPTFIPAHLHYRVSVLPAVESTKAVNVQAATNPVPAGKLPVRSHVLGTEQQNIHLANPATLLRVLLQAVPGALREVEELFVIVHV